MAKASSPERRGGRPTQAEAAALHQRLREAAVKTFLENGYDATTMVAIAEAAGITKPTLYARYPDKRAVFLDVIPWAFSRAVQVDTPDAADDEDLRSALVAVGEGALRHALNPDIVQLHKIARNEAHRFPEFKLSAESLGWASRQQQVMDLLRRHAEAGTIEVEDIELTAEHFLAMVEVLPARLADFGLYRTRKEARRRLLHAVDLFLHGVLAR
ncbi:AcrR family transcriptional regulator [Mycolicibacterium sp. BK556]|uniref:TetR/AcrR family transcriptional regulator n=1 Tax=Mycobacteriaceae TaxID=1762 RepID=UPI00105EC3D8|nr:MULTISPECIES: TetR/AcrR family transcriptional regulator [Mycobacteriaceae]MBB3602946.1 AcrR family transcriptional regulator [Mycolicibacterium sp. BK556]MBB3633141.1 AcrR family transcriptional regulator [Mycolicibacterium sp. BK607]MBB3750691.1 AcrR family transcriptional regulator [Mycolicibacterium sp. BK634]TDO07115.1 TetR family transcriptional regulator [Mycobacterium sp. BK086]